MWEDMALDFSEANSLHFSRQTEEIYTSVAIIPAEFQIGELSNAK